MDKRCRKKQLKNFFSYLGEIIYCSFNTKTKKSDSMEDPQFYCVYKNVLVKLYIEITSQVRESSKYSYIIRQILIPFGYFIKISTWSEIHQFCH